MLRLVLGYPDGNVSKHTEETNCTKLFQGQEELSQTGK